jgi:hypothetical protein
MQDRMVCALYLPARGDGTDSNFNLRRRLMTKNNKNGIMSGEDYAAVSGETCLDDLTLDEKAEAST